MLLPSGLVRRLFTRGWFRFCEWGADVVAHFDDLANKKIGGITVRIFKLLISLILLSLVNACGGGGGGSTSNPSPVVVTPPPPSPEPTGLWVNSETDGETEGSGLADYTAKLTRIGMTRSATGGPVFEAAPVADTSSGGGGFSTTYTHEGYVEENDIEGTTGRSQAE